MSLTRTNVVELCLTRDEVLALERFRARLQADPYAADAAAYDRWLSALADDIPLRLRRLSTWFGHDLGAAGVVVVHGLPIPDDLPPTPTVPYDTLRQPTGTEPFILGVGSLIGHVFGFAGWRGGDRVHNVYPVADDAGTQKASNAVRLAFHTEAAFDALSPEALVLLILRGAAGAPPSTGFCDLHQVYDSLPPDEQALLGQCAFHPLSFDRQGEAFPGPAEYLVRPDPRGLRFHYIPAIVGATAAHDAALEHFRERMEETATEITLQAGDMVLIDNTHVVHGRTAQSPGFAGRDRWLQRCLVRGPSWS